jgi:hypothetical protein
MTIVYLGLNLCVLRYGWCMTFSRHRLYTVLGCDVYLGVSKVYGIGVSNGTYVLLILDVK